MRDIINDVVTYQDTTTHPYWGAPIVATWNVTERFSYRSESISTQPRSGRFVLPTYYKTYDTRRLCPEYSVHWAADKRYQQTGKMPDELWFVNPLNYGTDGSQYPAPVCHDSIYERVRGILVSRILNSQFDLGQSLGEMDETISLIVKTSANVLRAYRAVRNGNFTLAAQLLGTGSSRKWKSPAEAWLELQYGWKPLISDVYGLCELLSEGLKVQPFIVSATVLDDTFGPIKPYGHLTKVVKVEGTFVRGLTSKVCYEVADQLAHDLVRLGVANPLSLAWELLPLSFVVDWFLGIGIFLQSLALPIGLKFNWRYETEFLKTAWTAKDVDPNWVQIRPRVQYHRSKGMRRTIFNSFPVPTPYFRLPVDPSKVASLLALIAQARK